MIQKKLLFIFIFFGIFFQKNDIAFGFWHEPFSFTNDDGNKITIYKYQSNCEPKGVIYEEKGKYGSSFKKFSHIYPLCNFKGVETTYSGIRYQYQRSVKCEKNIYICKAAGEYGLTGILYQAKRIYLEQKLNKEVNKYNEDFKEREEKSKNRLRQIEERTRQRQEKERKEEHKRSTLAPWISYRNNCLSIINNGVNRYDYVSPRDGITPRYEKRNSCFLYVLEEPKVLNAGYKLPASSISSQIPKKLLLLRVDGDNSLKHMVMNYNNSSRSYKGKYINCYEGSWGYEFKYHLNDRFILCKFTDQVVSPPSRKCLNKFLYGEWVTNMNKEFFCKEMFL